MTGKTLDDLARDLRDDAALQAALEAVADENDEISMDAFLRVVAERGYGVTRADFDTAAAAPAELDDAQLEGVIGGVAGDAGGVELLAGRLGRLRLRG